MDTLQIEKVSPDLSFPLRLYILMRDAEDEFPSIISWEPSSNGTIFQVHDADELEKKVLPKYFRSSIKFSSFRRQLLGYGFQCVGKLQYKHENFIRGDSEGCERILRVKKTPKRSKATRVPLPLQQANMASFTNNHTERHPDVGGTPVFVHMEGMKRLLVQNFRTHPSQTYQQQQEEYDMDDGSDDFEPIPYSPITDDESPSNSATSSPDSSMRGVVARNIISPLEDLWYNLIESTQQELEPRTIQAMVKSPNPWYENTPTMNPNQQAWLEFTMAGSLPGILYWSGMSKSAHVCGLVLVLAHCALCFLTNFGGGAWCVDGFGPIQHIGGDMLLNHSFNSILLLLGPNLFGPYVYPLTLCLILANNATAAMNFKIHFETFILKSNKEDETAAKLLQHKLGGHIRRMVIGTLGMVGLLGSACYFGNATTLALAVLVYNILPFWVDLSYWLTFSKELQNLPARNRTILSDERFNLLRSRPKEKKA